MALFSLPPSPLELSLSHISEFNPQPGVENPDSDLEERFQAMGRLPWARAPSRLKPAPTRPNANPEETRTMQPTVTAGALDGASFDSRNNLLREHFHGLPIINNRLDRDLMNARFLHVVDRLHNLIHGTG